MTTYLSADNPQWHYEPKPVNIQKLVFLGSDGQARIGYQRGWLFGRDYVAWMPLKKYNQLKFNTVTDLWKRHGHTIETDRDWTEILENNNAF